MLGCMKVSSKLPMFRENSLQTSLPFAGEWAVTEMRCDACHEHLMVSPVQRRISSHPSKFICTVLLLVSRPLLKPCLQWTRSSPRILPPRTCSSMLYHHQMQTILDLRGNLQLQVCLCAHSICAVRHPPEHLHQSKNMCIHSERLSPETKRQHTCGCLGSYAIVGDKLSHHLCVCYVALMQML